MDKHPSYFGGFDFRPEAGEDARAFVALVLGAAILVALFALGLSVA